MFCAELTRATGDAALAAAAQFWMDQSVTKSPVERKSEVGGALTSSSVLLRDGGTRVKSLVRSEEMERKSQKRWCWK